jgi:hypothetical protein
MNNMVNFDSKEQFALLYKEIHVDYYFANQIRIILKKGSVDTIYWKNRSKG